MSALETMKMDKSRGFVDVFYPITTIFIKVCVPTEYNTSCGL